MRLAAQCHFVPVNSNVIWRHEMAGDLAPLGTVSPHQSASRSQPSLPAWSLFWGSAVGALASRRASGSRSGDRHLRPPGWLSPRSTPRQRRLPLCWCAGKLACHPCCGKLKPMRTTSLAGFPPHNMAIDTDVLAAGFRLPMVRRSFLRYTASGGALDLPRCAHTWKRHHRRGLGADADLTSSADSLSSRSPCRQIATVALACCVTTAKQ